MNASTQSGSSYTRNLRLLLIFLTLGLALAWGAYYVSNDFQRFGIWPVIAVLVLAPIAGWVCVAGLREGRRRILHLKAEWTWWHGLIFLLYISTLVFRVRDVGAASSQPIDAWALLRLGPEALVAGALAIRLITRHTLWLDSMFRGLLGALAIYGLVCIVSSSWSVYASWTLYKSVEFLLDVAVLAAILATVESALAMRSMLNWIWTLYAAELAWTWVGAAIWPAEAFDETFRLSGVWPMVASNSIGVSGAIISIVALARLLSPTTKKSERGWYSVVFGFGFISLVASQTRNALAGFVFGAFLVLWYQRRAWVAVFTSALIIPLIFFTSLGPRIGDYLAREQTESQIEGLSARTIWWSYAWQQLMQHPLTGLGAYAAGKFAVLGHLGIGEASQMHSDWIEILAGTSFWGLIPFAVAVIGCWWILGRTFWDRTLSPSERGLSCEALGVLGVITLRSFFNVELMWHVPFLFLAVLGYAEFLRRQKKQQKMAWGTSRVSQP